MPESRRAQMPRLIPSAPLPPIPAPGPLPPAFTPTSQSQTKPSPNPPLIDSSSSFVRISSRNCWQALRPVLVVPCEGLTVSAAAASGDGPDVPVIVRIPTTEPEGALAGFETGSIAELRASSPAGAGSDSAGPGALAKVAGFDPSDPEGALAGFGSVCACCMTFATVPRSRPSCRAMRRCDQCDACSRSIA